MRKVCSSFEIGHGPVREAGEAPRADSSGFSLRSRACAGPRGLYAFICRLVGRVAEMRAGTTTSHASSSGCRAARRVPIGPSPRARAEAACLREGLAETLTITRLGVHADSTLGRSRSAASAPATSSASAAATWPCAGRPPTCSTPSAASGGSRASASSRNSRLSYAVHATGVDETEVRESPPLLDQSAEGRPESQPQPGQRRGPGQPKQDCGGFRKISVGAARTTSSPDALRTRAGETRARASPRGHFRDCPSDALRTHQPSKLPANGHKDSPRQGPLHEVRRCPEMYPFRTRVAILAVANAAKIPAKQIKPTRGLEPRTPSLRVKCSTS
jgi:hypothetical protein